MRAILFCYCSFIYKLNCMINSFRLLVRIFTGIYFGKPRGFGTNDKGEDIGFNTEVYSSSEVYKTHILLTLDF